MEPGLVRARRISLVLCGLLLAIACHKKAAPTPATVQLGPVAAVAIPPQSSPTALPPRPSLAPLIASMDGKIALQQARALCALGSRDPQSPGHAKARIFLIGQLKRVGWQVTESSFDADTPLGKRRYTNLIAAWPNARPAGYRIVLSAHYDAPGSSVVIFPAASSGAAGCGVLLELAERLARFPSWAAGVNLVFFDGESPLQQFSATDGLFGSRFYIHFLTQTASHPPIRALLAYGAIGHANAHWTLPTMTPNELGQDLLSFALEQKWEAQVADFAQPSWGAHLPALQAGIPAIFLNDALYPSQGTADDTPEQLAAEPLRRAALAGIALLEKTASARPEIK